jgi:citrate lyase alpha subunit
MLLSKNLVLTSIAKPLVGVLTNGKSADSKAAVGSFGHSKATSANAVSDAFSAIRRKLLHLAETFFSTAQHQYLQVVWVNTTSDPTDWTC